jgi:polyisoprenoid-binding protein YceI
VAVAGLLLALAGGVANAAPVPPPPPVPAALPECRGRIDATASEARFVVDIRLPIKAEGRFAGVDGELKPRPGGECEVHVRLRADTVEYSGPEWMAKLTRSPAFLDAETHPDVAFDSVAFPSAWLNEGGSIRGRLKLRGRERPVEFALRPAECDTPGKACAIRVSGEVSRRDFGMQAYRFTVKDNVRFEFAIRLQAAP